MRSIITYPADVLREPCTSVQVFDEQLRDLVAEMASVMYSADGVGIAAPQVASNHRVLLIDPSGGDESNRLQAMINPCVTWRSPELSVGTEGCLSLPGVRLEVPRSVAIDIEYYDTMGVLHLMRAVDWPARIVQHEVDHLDGLLMIDRVGPLARKHALKDLSRPR